MIKRFALFALALFLLISLLPTMARAESFDTNIIEEPYFIVVDANAPSQALLGLERKADDRVFPASTTKIITCIIALEYAGSEGHSLDDQIKISATASSASFGPGNSLMGVSEDETYTLRELLYGLMLISGNDAAVAIAEHIGGSESGFAELMNQKAQAVGMTGTHFVTPHGKHNSNHYSTARDMAILTGYALKNPEFVQISKTPEYTATEVKTGKQLVVRNTNRLICDTTPTEENPSPISCQYDYAIGVKTGDTNQAGKCLVAAAEFSGMRVIAVLLGGTLNDAEYTENGNKWKASRKEPYNAKRFQDAILLFDHVFNELTIKITIGDLITQGLPSSFEVQTENYSEDDSAQGVLTLEPNWDISEQLMLMAPTKAALDASIGECAQARYYNTTAPIHLGDVVGDVDYMVNGNVILTAKLVATREVKEGIIAVSATDNPADRTGSPLITTPSPDPKPINGFPTVAIIVIAVVAFLLFFIILLLIIRRRVVIKRRKQEEQRRRRREMQRREMQRQAEQRRYDR